ncbi:MAG TPA: hypothetical protein DDX91_04345 [Ruminococcaceae bacterium]|nr:hypothetical protein [Oscillospiraceae bacterium]
MYAYNKTSSAYDLSAFDTAVKRERKPEKPRSEDSIKIHKTSAARSGAWFKTVIFTAAAVVAALLFVTAKATISELSAEIGTSTSMLEEAKKENTRLQTELGNMVTLSRVDEIATNSLGLQKTAKTQIKYITVYDKTMVQSAGGETNVFKRLKSWADSAAEYLGF